MFLAGSSPKDLRRLFVFGHKASSNELVLSNFPIPNLGYTRTTLYIVDGEAEFLEVMENDLLFSHYD
jgi:hypothetical protein